MYPSRVYLQNIVRGISSYWVASDGVEILCRAFVDQIIYSSHGGIEIWIRYI